MISIKRFPKKTIVFPNEQISKYLKISKYRLNYGQAFNPSLTSSIVQIFSLFSIEVEM
jgi:hypothetical protein